MKSGVFVSSGLGDRAIAHFLVGGHIYPEFSVHCKTAFRNIPEYAGAVQQFRLVAVFSTADSAEFIYLR